MSQSRGALRFEPLFASEELGLHAAANVEHVIKAFLVAAEGLAMRRIEMPQAVLLLQTVPGNSESGAIYLYDRQLQHFYIAVFDEGSDDSFTTADFDQLVEEYELLSFAENPRTLLSVTTPGRA